MAGRLKAGVAALAAGLAVAAAAAAATAVSPDASKMTLQTKDLPGSKLVAHGAVHQAGFTGYERAFQLSTPLGRSGILFVDSIGLLGDTPARATSAVATYQRVLRSPTGRNAIVAAIAKSARVKKSDIKLSPVRAARVGDHAFELPLRVHLKGGYVYESLLYMSLDRVVVEHVVGGLRPITAADSARLATVVQAHVGTELTPASLTPPAVTGNAQQGSTLTASAGTWTNTSPTLTYQWQRCDATGANCADIAGATAQTYLLDVPDVGTTVRVMVSGSNRFGAAKAPSAATTVVTPLPPPPPGP